MGGSVSRILSMIWSKKEIRILILGLVRISRSDREFLLIDPPGQCGQNNSPVSIESTHLVARNSRVAADCANRSARSSQQYQPLVSTWNRWFTKISTLTSGYACRLDLHDRQATHKDAYRTWGVKHRYDLTGGAIMQTRLR